MEGLEVGEDPFGPASEDERDGVDPMGADVADRPQFAPLRGEQTPVEVGVVQQPVLEEVSLHMDDPAEIAAGDHGPHLQDRREEPAHVVHREHRGGGFPHGRDHAGRLLGIHAQRLLADHVLAGLEGLQRLRHVHLVGRGDMHNVHLR